MAIPQFKIIPNVRSLSSIMKEKDSVFTCPNKTVLTGRWHKGDENGNTQYEYSTLRIIDDNGNIIEGLISIEDIIWDKPIKESSGIVYNTPPGRVLVGRKHLGDENGMTQYATGLLKVNNTVCVKTTNNNSIQIKESTGIWYKTDNQSIMTGRCHNGDENGKTYYCSSEFVVSSQSEHAPIGSTIIPVERELSIILNENGHTFMCPQGTVMTGRKHMGDENGSTQYEYATLRAINANGEFIVGNVTFCDVRWEENIKESDGIWFNTTNNRVIVGRKHYGDENGLTQYATAAIKFNGWDTFIWDKICSIAIKESSGEWYKTNDRYILTGRYHSGDENGNSFYNSGVIHTESQVYEGLKIIIALHPDEEFYPMSPEAFISSAKLRKHVPGKSDLGYNKETHQFDENNSVESKYFNIPVDILNSFHNSGSDALLNLRPRDINSIGTNEVFLQTRRNMTGVRDPNGQVPVYTYSSFYKESNTNRVCERKEFWIFYGYNKAERAGISVSHQGDWERVIVDIANGRIKGAWLSQHEKLEYYNSNQLVIENNGNSQTLKIFSAIGSHAHYNEQGNYEVLKIGKLTLFEDCALDGYQWEITKNVQELNTQPWVLFSGAWGEVGTYTEIIKDSTTGPLGPWYKTWNFGKVNDDIPLSRLIGPRQVLIIPDKRFDSASIIESAGTLFTAPSNMVITGRKHNKDENNQSMYELSTLKAVDMHGNVIPGEITISDLEWSEEHIESTSQNFYMAPTGRVITGRCHSGDENGKTKYQTGRIFFNGYSTTVLPAPNEVLNFKTKESGGIYFRTDTKFLLVGQTHFGDENDVTCYFQGFVICSI